METLTIRNNKSGEKMVCEVIGRVDIMTAPQFEEEIMADLDGVKELELDFRQVEYISSAGLRVLVLLEKKMTGVNESMTICEPQDSVFNIFKATGMTDFLKIEK